VAVRGDLNSPDGINLLLDDLTVALGQDIRAALREVGKGRLKAILNSIYQVLED
jgi:hypothetical protein